VRSKGEFLAQIERVTSWKDKAVLLQGKAQEYPLEFIAGLDLL
jgi:hypothetical protein